jgi:hypothetical protein
MHGSASFSRTINPAADGGNAIVSGGAEGNCDPLYERLAPPHGNELPTRS